MHVLILGAPAKRGHVRKGLMILEAFGPRRCIDDGVVPTKDEGKGGKGGHAGSPEQNGRIILHGAPLLLLLLRGLGDASVDPMLAEAYARMPPTHARRSGPLSPRRGGSWLLLVACLEA